jgi:hypothetical protein
MRVNLIFAKAVHVVDKANTSPGRTVVSLVLSTLRVHNCHVHLHRIEARGGCLQYGRITKLHLIEVMLGPWTNHFGSWNSRQCHYSIHAELYAVLICVRLAVSSMCSYFGSYVITSRMSCIG